MQAISVLFPSHLKVNRIPTVDYQAFQSLSIDMICRPCDIDRTRMHNHAYKIRKKQ